MKHKLFEVPPYEQTVRVLWRDEIDAFNKKYGTELSIADTAKGAFYFNYATADDNRWIIILPRKWSEDIVWHEALHCVFRVFDFVGVKTKVGNTEPLAYTQAWVVDRIIEFYERGG